jgi:hypothetical protein
MRWIPATPVPMLPLLGAALLSACGGGGSDAGSGATAIDDTTATAYAANATLTASDAMGAADTAVLTAQSLVASFTSAASSGTKANALAADAKPLTTSAVTRACAGGGSATLSIGGGDPAAWNNGRFDAGEVYQITYSGCKGFAGWTTVDGSLSLTVDAASGDTSNGSLAVSLAATNLTVATPRGSASLNGNATRTLSVATDANGVVLYTSRYVAPSITWVTQYGARTSTFTLSAVDIRRTATVANGVLQSSSIDGTHTLSATLPNGSFAYSVATQGAATYAGDGTPLAGSWTIELPQDRIVVTVANGAATWTLDRGKDGTIDRTVTVPIAQFESAAG